MIRKSFYFIFFVSYIVMCNKEIENYVIETLQKSVFFLLKNNFLKSFKNVPFKAEIGMF